jgi:hypothetical protein
MATQTRKTNPAFIQYLEDRSFNVLLFREEIQNILKKQSQPLTIVEIMTLVAQQTGRKVDKMTMHAHVKELVKEGNLISRVETPQERTLRANNRVTSGPLATLYITPRNWSKTVPARTVAEAIPGVVLASVDDRRYRKSKAKKRGRPAGSKNKIKPEARGTDLNDIIAKLVQAHQSSVSQELEETREKLELTRKTLSELLQKIS